MSEPSEAAANFYALLIGIDYYLPTPLYRSLGGAVQDINLVAQYLEKKLDIPSDRLSIFKLTSPNPEAVSSDSQQPKDPLPTYENIVAAFQKITESASKDDQVYVHYSGHGGRADTIFADVKGEGQHDEGLAPMDVGAPGGRYLRDLEMATLLKRMTDKGLVVTVILDSCHSGGATRGDCDVRGARDGEIDSANRPQDSLVATREELIRNWQLLTGADDGSERVWLPQADGYVMLAACRPSESAMEYKVNGKEKHGALTYWMMDTLTTIPTDLTYKALHDRVNAKIQSKFPGQIPMLTGQGDRQVFGSARLATPYTVNVFSVSADLQTVRLNAGMAQGVSSGMQFAIYPLNTKEFLNKQLRVAIVELTDIEAVSSTAKVLSPTEGGMEVKDAIEQGAPAVLVSTPPNLIRRVRLFDQKQSGDREDELPPEWVDKQQQALAAVREALAGNGLIKELLPDETQEADYQVAIGREGEYEICIGTPLKNLRPALRVGDVDAAQKVVKRLAHLATYQTAKAIDNPDSELTNSLEFELLDRNKQPVANPYSPKLKQGEIVFIRLKNISHEILNVAVLDFDATWAISQLYVQSDGEAFYALEPSETKTIRLQFALPEADEQAAETLKLFATRGAANFQWLVLPSLDQPPEQKPASRSASSPFGQLLEAMGADVDAPPLMTRAAMRVPDPSQEWVTKQIQLTIDR